jgi:aldehyde dehydrogenase (NAD+)
MSTNRFGSESRMLVGGALSDALSGATFGVINPATEEVVAQVADGTVEDMGRAVAAARAAADESPWGTDRALRKRVLAQFRDAVKAELDAWRPELVAEVGTPILMTYGPQLDGPALDNFEWALEMIDSFPWERELPPVEQYGATSRGLVLKEPLGVVGAIVPWNYPVEVSMAKIVPALAAGNTVILKPAPDTPLNATRLGRIFAEQVDAPPGVFSVVPSSDNLVGEALVTDPRVDAISFTGSTATGRRIMAAGAPTLKRLFLELGGKSAMIMLDDADLDEVVAAASGLCWHAGQGCSMLTRLLLPASRYDEGVEKLGAAFASFPYGDPMDPQIYMGPVISQRQRERVLGYVQKGIEGGARLVTGGHAPSSMPKGFFVEPTLFVDVSPDSVIAQEEIFGPVLCVIAYEGEDDAVKIANNSVYGLSGAVLSASTDRALAVARRIRTGTMSINNGMYFRRDMPFGGYKASGIGRQAGPEGFDSLLETKAIGVAVR